MELILNTFGVSLNHDNDGFVITNKDGRQRIPTVGISSIQKSGDKTIFVPANLLKNSSITDKITVKGEYVPSFDKKKGKEGYKAVRITK